MSERVYGKKYDKNLSSKDVAGRVRADIKDAIKKGELPEGLKVSVRYSSYSMGCSIEASITGWPKDLLWLNPKWVIFNKTTPDTYSDNIPRYTKKAKAILQMVEEIRDAYNHDGSDSQTDYFDVKYAGSTQVWWELERPESQRIYNEWTQSAPKSNLSDIVLGDEVIFVRGELKGMRFVITHIGNEGPKNIHGGLCFGLRQLDGDADLFADGYDLNGLAVVKSMPTGMKVLRFKR
jgi:hypothetical protein